MARTEELLASSTLLNNLNESWLQLLNRWHVVGKDTHISRLSGNVDLNNILRLVDCLQKLVS
jgi:hypothetical protein